MANSKSAEKRARVASRRRAINRRKASQARSASKSMLDLATSVKTEEAAKKLPSVQSEVDRAVKTGAIQRNKAARMKSKLARAVSSK